MPICTSCDSRSLKARPGQPNLPLGVEPQLGPVSTGLGEIFMYSVEYADSGGDGARAGDGGPGWQSDGSYLADDGERSSDDIARFGHLRTVQDWIIKPQLKTVPGAADIELAWRLRKTIHRRAGCSRAGGTTGLSYSDIAKALLAANLAVGRIISAWRRGVSPARGRPYQFHRRDRPCRDSGFAQLFRVTSKDVALRRILERQSYRCTSRIGWSRDRHCAELTGRKAAGPWQRRSAKISGDPDNLPPGIVANVLLDRLQLRQCDHHDRSRTLRLVTPRHRRAVPSPWQCPRRNHPIFGHSVVIRDEPAPPG